MTTHELHSSSHRRGRTLDRWGYPSGSEMTPLQLASLAAAAGVAFGLIVVLTVVVLTGAWNAA